jgi:hypothetical protein
MFGVCVCAFSLHRESPIDLEVTNPSFLRWFCHSQRSYPIKRSKDGVIPLPQSKNRAKLKCSHVQFHEMEAGSEIHDEAL